MALPDGEVNKRFKKAIWALPILVFASIFSHITRLFGGGKRKEKTERRQKKENMKIAIESPTYLRLNKHGMDFVALETIRELQRRNDGNEYYVIVRTR